MRMPRVFGDPTRSPNFYHCHSRLLGELPDLVPEEEVHFCSILEKLLGFSGLELIDYRQSDKAFHLALAVPSDRESLEAMSDPDFLKRLAYIYPAGEVEAIGLRLQAHRQAGQETDAVALRAPYLKRMHNLSAFMKELKQSFTTWYNRRHRRSGTIWLGRFKSELAEDSPSVSRAMVNYISLNRVAAVDVESNPIPATESDPVPAPTNDHPPRRTAVGRKGRHRRLGISLPAGPKRYRALRRRARRVKPSKRPAHTSPKPSQLPRLTPERKGDFYYESE